MATATKTKKAKKATTTKTTKKASEVRLTKLAIIKHAKHLTKKPATQKELEKSFTARVDDVRKRSIQYVYYDGENLNATDSSVAVRVPVKLPYESGTYFDNKGNVVEPDSILKDFPFPIKSLDHIFSSYNEYASMTLEGKEQIMELLEHIKKMTIEAVNAKKLPNKIDLNTLLKIDFKDNAGVFSIYKKEGIKPYEVTGIKTHICDELKEPEIDGKRIRTRYQLRFEKEKRERFLADHPFLKHPALVNPLYFYWTLRVLLEHGADKVKIIRDETMIWLESSVGRAVIVLVRDNSIRWNA